MKLMLVFVGDGVNGGARNEIFICNVFVGLAIKWIGPFGYFRKNT